MNRSDTDIIHISDFRIPGPLMPSVAEEIRAESEAGFRTHVIHASSTQDGKARGWHAQMRATLAWSNVEVASSHAALHAQLIVVHHPQVVLDCPETFDAITGDRLLLIASEELLSNSDMAGDYDIRAISRRAEKLFGRLPEWAVHDQDMEMHLREQGFQGTIIEPHWRRIVRIYGSDVPRGGPRKPVPVLGRHGDVTARSWPATEAELWAAYPSDPMVAVYLRGGPGSAFGLQNHIPGWSFSTGTEETVTEYLEKLDFWVFFPAPDYQGSNYGPVYEALAMGLVVILPYDYKQVFGDAALYGEPSDVVGLVREYHEDESRFLAQSRRAQDYIRSLGPAAHIDRLACIGIVPRVEVPDAGSDSARGLTKGTKRILFVTSNGAGMGHLTRLLAVANRLPVNVECAFASLSLGVHIVDQYGHPYEYIPSREATGIPNAEWNEYAHARFSMLFDGVKPDALVFDGVWPYRGLRSALKGTGIECIWMRRGMWRAESSSRPLAWATEFDMIIEPGEFSTDYDKGPTATARQMHTTRIAPITLLSQENLLSREEARSELGYGANDKVALITLGAGNINDIGSLQESVVTWFKRFAPEWRIVVTKPPIALDDSLDNVDMLQVYPLAKYTRAFDMAVSAAGYNAFHEWMVGELPTLWVPNLFTKTDDQQARARWAADHGYGTYLPNEEDEQSLHQELQRMTNLDELLAMRERLKDINKTNGAVKAAALIAGAR